MFLLSGDRDDAVLKMGEKVGIEKESIKASLTPEQKSSFISKLQSEGHRVAMVTYLYLIMPMILYFSFFPP